MTNNTPNLREQIDEIFEPLSGIDIRVSLPDGNSFITTDVEDAKTQVLALVDSEISRKKEEGRLQLNYGGGEMNKTISFYDKDFDGKSFEVPDELDIRDKFDALLWLYDKVDFHYLSMYDGIDPFGWFNDANWDAKEAVLKHLKREYLRNKQAEVIEKLNLKETK